MCSCEDGEYAEVWIHETPRARKVHKCGECSRPIQKGTMHDFYRWLYEGYWRTARRCPGCSERAKAFQSAEGCQALVGTLLEQLRECSQEDSDFLPRYVAARR